MSRSALEELQHLKALLAATGTPEARRTSNSSQASPAVIEAQSTVAALEKALDAGDEGMEDAIRESGAMKNQSAAQRENEILDLQRIISARERSLESLRSTLDTTKQFYEDRLAEAAARLTAKDAEIETMRSDLVRSKEDQDGLIQQMTGQQQDAAEEMADLHRSYEEEAREAREHHSQELDELQDALQAQEQEVEQLQSDVSQAHERCQEAQSQAEELQSELTALQGLQAEKDRVSCTQQFQKYKTVIQKQEARLEDMHESLQEAKDLQTGTLRQLQAKQAAVKRLRLFLKAELKASGEIEGILIAAQKMLGCKHQGNADPDGASPQCAQSRGSKQIALGPARASLDTKQSHSADKTSRPQPAHDVNADLQKEESDLQGSDTQRKWQVKGKQQRTASPHPEASKSPSFPCLQILSEESRNSRPNNTESNACSSSEESQKVSPPLERPRKRKQVSPHKHPGQRNWKDIAETSRLDEELGKLKLLLDE